ncbi:hypothetical protein GM3708_3556 (plasmid) [Geminocystis sp. NIES-3708]|uniref:hypothetical protein n=1 Tax=Geminocystis sp. NIES-3708 TaxID=1615909 RepID=UPI0005FCDAAE|nr:hypothetical protein [Geminocystis sp. NIES-3708]BAQ63150.1 hypothetical protein GM3708_3556 [Geminocystis sp. NIES-3708]
MYEVDTQLAGKNIFTYAPKGNKSYSEQDIAQYLKKFKLCDALRLIGEISYQILKSSKQSKIHIEGIPIFDGVLAYIAMLLIENSNDYRSENLTMNNLLQAIDMYFGLKDPFEDTGENPESCLIRFGSTQLNYERELRHGGNIGFVQPSATSKNLVKIGHFLALIDKLFKSNLPIFTYL